MSYQQVNLVRPQKSFCDSLLHSVIGGRTNIREVDMTTKLSYKIFKAVGEESSKDNTAFEQLEQFVNEHIREGWRPVG